MSTPFALPAPVLVVTAGLRAPATALRALGLARLSIAARAPPVSSPIPDPEQSFVPAGARCSRILPPFPVLSRLKARLSSLLRLNSNLSRHQQACAEPSAES